MKDLLYKLIEMLDAQVKSIELLKEFADAQVKSIELLKEFALEFIELAEPPTKITESPINKDPLGLTKPPPGVKDFVRGDRHPVAWKYCFVAYRHQTYGENKKEIAELLHNREGYVDNLRRRKDYRRENNPPIVFSQKFVDIWPEKAKEELTKIYQDERDLDKERAEQLALSLLPPL